MFRSTNIQASVFLFLFEAEQEKKRKRKRKVYNYFKYVISKISSIYFMLWHVHVPQNKSANQYLNVCTFCVMSWDLFPSLLTQDIGHKQMTGRVEKMKKIQIMFKNCSKMK